MKFSVIRRRSLSLDSQPVLENFIGGSSLSSFLIFPEQIIVKVFEVIEAFINLNHIRQDDLSSRIRILHIFIHYSLAVLNFIWIQRSFIT